MAGKDRDARETIKPPPGVAAQLASGASGKHRAQSHLGYPLIGSGGEPEAIEFEHTPPPVALPDPLDPIEKAALNIQRRSDQIVGRPGPSPTQGSLQVAITLAGFQAELSKQIADLKDHINSVVLDELKADRTLKRNAEAQEIVDKAAWSKLVRDVTYRVVAGLGAAAAIVYGILKAAHVL